MAKLSWCLLYLHSHFFPTQVNATAFISNEAFISVKSWSPSYSFEEKGCLKKNSICFALVCSGINISNPPEISWEIGKCLHKAREE